MASEATEHDCELEKEDISELMKSPLRKGDTWFLIAMKWFKRWKKFVGYDSRHMWDARAHPGPIDNSSLYQHDQRGKKDEKTLKKNMMDNVDYVLVPHTAWDKLVSWYTLTVCQKPTARKVIEYGTFCKYYGVEVYLMHLELCDNINLDNAITKHFSRADTIGAIERDMRLWFHIDDKTDVRLRKKNMTGMFEHLKKMDSTVQEAGLYPGQTILIEQRNHDGTWRQQTSLMSSSTRSSSHQCSEKTCQKTGDVEKKKNRKKPANKKTSMPTAAKQIEEEDINHDNRDLECPVCQEVFRTPKILPCGHTFCLNPCLQQLTKHKTSVKCPECRSDHSLPAGGVEKFPTNIVIVRMIEQVSRPEQNVTFCPVCKEEGFLCKCFHCSVAICEVCRAGHTEDMKTETLQKVQELRKHVADTKLTELADTANEELKTVTSAYCDQVISAMDTIVEAVLNRKQELLDTIGLFADRECVQIAARVDAMQGTQNETEAFCASSEEKLSSRKVILAQSKLANIKDACEEQSKLYISRKDGISNLPKMDLILKADAVSDAISKFGNFDKQIEQ